MQAYKAVFIGSPSDDDQNLVLMDLADKSGFFKYTVPAPGVSLEFIEGQRALFANIYGYLRLSDDELRALQEAAHESSATRQALENSEEGL